MADLTSEQRQELQELRRLEELELKFGNEPSPEEAPNPYGYVRPEVPEPTVVRRNEVRKAPMTLNSRLARREVPLWGAVDKAIDDLAYNALQVGTLGYADEGIAGLSSLFDYAGNKLFGDRKLTLEDAYTNRWEDLQDIGERTSLGSKIAGSLVGAGMTNVPLLTKMKDAPLLARALGAGGVGGAESFVYGTGASTKQGLEPRLQSGVDAMKFGAPISAMMPILGAPFRRAGEAVEDFGGRSKRASTGITKSDLDLVDRSRSGKAYRKATGKNRLVDAFENVDEQGVFSINPLNKGTHNPEKIINNLSNKIEEKAVELSDDFFKPANKALAELGEEVNPNWTRIKRELMLATEEGVASEDLPRLFQKVDDIKANWEKKAKIKNFTRANKEKQIRQTKARYGQNPSPVEMEDALVNRKIAQEYKRAILKKAKDLDSKGKLSKNAREEIERLNKEMSDMLEVRQVIEKHRNLPERREFGKLVGQLASTTGMGTGGYLLGSALTGSPGLALLAAAIAGSRVPQARYGLGQGFQALGKGLGLTGKGLESDLVRALMTRTDAVNSLGTNNNQE